MTNDCNESGMAGLGAAPLFGDVFALVIEDRHSDTGVEVWTDRDAAIARAKALATEYAGYNGGPVDERAIQGWEYYASYSCENDSVRVVKVKLQSPNDRTQRQQPGCADDGTKTL